MKIAQVCPSYYPHSGGIETVVQEISERLVKKGLEVDVLTQDTSRGYNPCETINGVTVRRFRTGPWGWDFRFSTPSLRNYLMDNVNRYQIIHAHGYHSFPALFAAWAKSNSRLVFSPAYHGTGHNLLRTLLLLPYRHIGRTIFEKADSITCNSQAEKAIVQRHFRVPEEKIIVITNGINRENIVRATPFISQHKLLLYVGRLEKYKNIHLAIGAMPYLPSEYQLVVIGNGSYKGELEHMVEKLHLSDRVRIISGLSNDEVYRWYQTCNLVLLLSSQESFGIVVIEGLAAGKPVLVNNVGALAELAAKFEQVCPVDVAKVSELQLAEEMVRVCGKRFGPSDLSEYSWDSTAKQIERLYNRL